MCILPELYALPPPSSGKLAAAKARNKRLANFPYGQLGKDRGRGQLPSAHPLGGQVQITFLTRRNCKLRGGVVGTGPDLLGLRKPPPLTKGAPKPGQKIGGNEFPHFVQKSIVPNSFGGSAHGKIRHFFGRENE